MERLSWLAWLEAIGAAYALALLTLLGWAAFEVARPRAATTREQEEFRTLLAEIRGLPEPPEPVHSATPTYGP